MSYGPDLDETFSRVAALVDHILNGGQPQPAVRAARRGSSRHHLKTAQALGLEVPPALLASADEVIE